MKATELRIGNWVNAYDCEQQITEDSFNDFNWNDCKPIPLTEEWLKRCGFKKVNHIHNGEMWVHTLIKIIWYPNGMIELRGSAGWSRTHHVHQLQNLYYALTGEELTIKEDG